MDREITEPESGISCHELPDDETHWWSRAIGPMRLERQLDGSYLLWRRVLGHGDRFCGKFHAVSAAERMAGILAKLADEEWL